MSKIGDDLQNKEINVVTYYQRQKIVIIWT